MLTEGISREGLLLLSIFNQILLQFKHFCNLVKSHFFFGDSSLVSKIVQNPIVTFLESTLHNTERTGRK